MSTEQNSQELNDLKNLWQQTTTTDSLKIKEREMVREMQRDMDTFDERFGLGTWKMINTTGFATGLFIFFATRDFTVDSKANVVFIVLAAIQFTFFLFQIMTRLQRREYDITSLRGYIAYNLTRVQRQILWLKLPPIFIIILTGILTSSHPYFEISFLWWFIVLVIITVFAIAVVLWQYKYKLIPLRDKLQSALQQLNEH